MNENAKKWVAALRSGKYKPTMIVLRADDPFDGFNHCALGVLCEISGLGNWERVKEWTIVPEYSYLGESEYLPESVMEWAGLRTRNGRCLTDDGWKDLAFFNSVGFTFKRMADLIESEPDGLFK